MMGGFFSTHYKTCTEYITALRVRNREKLTKNHIYAQYQYLYDV